MNVSRAVLSPYNSNLFKTLYARPGVPIKRAGGLYVEDVDGKRYLDFMSGGTSVLGYSHPKVVDAIIAQVKKGADNPRSDHFPAIPELHNQLAEEVKSFLPERLSGGKVMFGHSGSDVVERAIRLVRFVTKRPMIISYFNAHHGSNATALSASPTMKEMGSNVISRFFQLPGFMHVPYPDPYRPWFGSDPESESSKNLEFLERLMASVVSPKMIAGIIVEPILSMGGNIVPPDGYFERLAELCKEHDIPLIADEVLTGIGKTGRMFAMEHWNVCPDAMCLGKALSGSLPLSLLVARDELAEKWEPKDHVPMGKDGHVLGCAAALAILRAARDERLADKAEKMGEYLFKRLQDLKEDWGLQGQVRGLGLMIGFDLVESDETKLPASDLAENIVQGALKRGLILGTVGVKGNVIRFMPALVVEREQVDRAIEILDQTLVEIEGKASN